jgi:hypothetical protein
MMVLAAGLLSFSASQCTQAAVSTWNFDSQNLTPSPNGLNATMSSGGTFELGGPTGSGYYLSLANNSTFTITLNPAGLSSFSLTYQGQRVQGNSAVQWSYSYDGGGYTTFGAQQGLNKEWTQGSVDWSSLNSILSGATSVSFRATAINGGRFDAVSLSAVPEPVHYALAIFGLIFVSTGVGRWYHGRMKRA